MRGASLPVGWGSAGEGLPLWGGSRQGGCFCGEGEGQFLCGERGKRGAGGASGVQQAGCVSGSGIAVGWQWVLLQRADPPGAGRMEIQCEEEGEGVSKSCYRGDASGVCAPFLLCVGGAPYVEDQAPVSDPFGTEMGPAIGWNVHVGLWVGGRRTRSYSAKIYEGDK